MRTISFIYILLLFGVYYICYREVSASCSTEKEQQFIKVPQDGLADVNPFKRTTVTSPIFCSFNCASYLSCLSFVFLKQQTTENCLLSTDPNGGSSTEDSEIFKSTIKQPAPYDQVCNKCQRGSKCTACSPGYYECECPPWAIGSHCQDLNPVYDHSLMPWKRGHGSLIRTVDISFNETWCTNIHDNIFIDENGTWKWVAGGLRQVTVGESGVMGVAGDATIWVRTGITTSNPKGTGWLQDTTGGLRQITSGRPGIVWGVVLDPHNQIYYKFDGGWQLVDSPFKWASCGKFGCWAIRTDGLAYFRTGVTASEPAGVSWVNTGGSFKQLDTGVRGDVYAVDNEGQLYTREGIREDIPYGQKWSKFGNMLLSHVSVGDKSVAGISLGTLYYYTLDKP